MPIAKPVERAPDEVVDLHVAAERANYSAEYLRTLIWRSDNPPPLFKLRGRWHVRLDEFDAWLAARDGGTAS